MVCAPGSVHVISSNLMRTIITTSGYLLITSTSYVIEKSDIKQLSCLLQVWYISRPPMSITVIGVPVVFHVL